MSKLEEVRQTQALHTSLLNSVLQQLNVSGGLASAELPEDMAFPMQTYEQVDAVDEKLSSDAATKKVLVSTE